MTAPKLSPKLPICAVWLVAACLASAEEPIRLDILNLDIVLDGEIQLEQTPSAESLRPLKLATQDARKELQTYMDGQITELADACDLSEPQVKRLTTAAKGAIDSLMEQWVRKIESWEWIERSGRLDRDTARRFLTNVGASESAVVRHKMWLNAVESTLTSAQRAQRSAALSERAMIKRKRAVLMAVSRLADELSLTTEQSGQLSKLMDEKIGRRLARQKDPPASVMAFARLLPLDDLKAIFNDEQFKLWEKMLEHAPGNEPLGF